MSAKNLKEIKTQVAERKRTLAAIQSKQVSGDDADDGSLAPDNAGASQDHTCYFLTQPRLASIPPMEASRHNALLRSDTKPPRLNSRNTFGNATSGQPQSFSRSIGLLMEPPYARGWTSGHT